ncbi:hypothetical protein RJ639_043255 [Escallonia herrerae]|uniref:Non-specific lipid-transfer protein n=1 Tax=Escallonia herrerae TaxID=1293975 RepID=A0AA89B947_9ASTE|nr:hypothetical protein RJ639_043255 [Escallonia herrerae]
MNSFKQAIPFAMPLLMLLLLLAPSSVAAITCSDVMKDLRPCITYLKSGSGKPPAPCCAGASALASAASTTADKRAACNCIKSAARSMNINTELAKALPGNCNIHLSFTISPSVDCSTIS